MKKQEVDNTPAPRPPRSIFVVYGRNVEARDALYDLLETAGLNPIRWQQAVSLGRDPSAFVGDIVEKGLAAADAVIILLSGDDLARTGRQYGSEPLAPQARPNVFLEAGMALVRFPAKTIFVRTGKSRDVSDLSGRHFIQTDGSVQPLCDLLELLAEVLGCSPFTVSPAKLVSISAKLVDPPEPRTLEVRHWIAAATAVLCLGLGFLAAWGVERFELNAVRISEKILTTEPVTVYFVGGHETLTTSDTLTKDIGYPRRLKILYAFGKKIIHEQNIRDVGPGKIELGVWDSEGYSTPKEGEKLFLRSNIQEKPYEP